MIDLIGNELSEPYSIFTYRYFLRQWPFLCYLAIDPTTQRCFGCVVAKMDVHRGKMLRGYIGMLTVEKEYRHLGVGKILITNIFVPWKRKKKKNVVLFRREIFSKFFSNFSNVQGVSWCVVQ